MIFSKKSIQSDMRKLMKCMNYVLDKTEVIASGHSSKNKCTIYRDIYQLLGENAWNDIASHCEHEYRVSKKHPTGRCSLCGTTRRGFRMEI